MNVTRGLELVMFCWIGIGVCFLFGWFMYLMDRWIPPFFMLAILGTLMAFFLGAILQ